MNVIYDDLYIPTSMQDVSGVEDLSDGKVDAVGLLYSDSDFVQYPTYPDHNQDGSGIAVQGTLNFYEKNKNKPTWTVKMLLPYGVANYYAIEGGSNMRL